MFIFRTGLLLATLLLSACSMPIFNDLQTPPSEQNNTASAQKAPSNKEKTNEIPTIQTSVITDSVDENLIEQLADQKKQAQANYYELKNRTGNAAPLPRITTATKQSNSEISTNLQALRSYISKTNTDLAQLNARVRDRQQMSINGDLIRIFLSEATVNHGTTNFKAQPIVGQWVRGESRVIRLKDNFLFESTQSEDVHITFSENYQLVINGHVISTVNPNRSKNDADFTVPSKDENGSIIGKIDYRIVEKN